jgi:hypothetical protein
MPNSSGTLERLAQELGTALLPLKDILSPEMFLRLGVELPPTLSANSGIVSNLESTNAVAREFTEQVQALEQAISDDNTGQIISSAVRLFATVLTLVTRLEGLGSALGSAAAALPPAERGAVQGLAEKLALRTLEYLIVNYLDVKMPMLTNTLAMAGVLDKNFRPAPNLEVVNSSREIVPTRFYFERLGNLFTKPEDHFKQAFAWGEPTFDGADWLIKLQALLEGLGIPAALYQDPGDPLSLEAYFVSVTHDSSPPLPGFKFELSLPGQNTFEQSIPLAGVWKGKVKTTANYAAGLEMTLKPPFALNVKPPTGNVVLDVQLSAVAEKDDGEPIDILSLAESSKLQAQKIETGVGLNLNLSTAGGDATPRIFFKIVDGKLIIDFSQGDGFIQQVLSGVQFDADFNIDAVWDPKRGLVFMGDAGLEILLPAHIDLGVLVIDGLYFKVGITSEAPLQLGLASVLTVNLGPLKGVIEKMGITIDFSFPANGKGRLGMADIDFKFQPPKGVGLSLDVGIVKGGGYLYFDTDKEEYAGILELGFAGIVTVKAIGLITTKMPDGSKGFSLLLIITAEFGTGIQLGFGFTLLGVGGILGLNRTMLLEPIAASIRSGGLNSIMFPPNPVANAARIISDLRTYFPPYEGKFLIGPMLKVGWGTPTIVSLSFGLIIEIPGNIAIVGILRVALPADELAIVEINVGFIGALEFDKKRIWFYAALFNSRILFLTLEGEMGLLMDYGDNPNFVLSVGGFHPLFNPPPLPFPNPGRIRISILSNPLQRISVECYFAVTSNTVQFGARAELYIGLAVVEISGHFALDALFQFSPFKFIISLSFSVSLKVFGIGLFSIHLELSLEGPTPWRARGTGRLTIDLWLFEISISAEFDITWGDAEDTSLPAISVLPLLETEFKKGENWRAKLPANSNLLVSLRKLDETAETLVLHPLGSLQITQRAVPLELNIDKVGQQKTGDGKRFSLKVESPELALSSQKPQEKFAIAQFQEMSNDQKLSRPAFQDFAGGQELTAAGKQLGSSKVVRRVVRYETIIIDTNYKRFSRKFFRFVGTLFNHFLGGAAVTKSALSQATKKAMVPYAVDDRVKVGEVGFSVASVANNKVHGETLVFTNEALARDFLQTEVRKQPNLTSELHVIPAHEALQN